MLFNEVLCFELLAFLDRDLFLNAEIFSVFEDRVLGRSFWPASSTKKVAEHAWMSQSVNLPLALWCHLSSP